MMNSKELMEQLEDCPVIAAVKDEEGLQACLGLGNRHRVRPLLETSAPSRKSSGS